MFRVICAKWGKYNDDTITQLHDNVKEKINIPFTFECFTEFSDEFDRYQYQKFDKDDTILYLDLDVIIKQDIDYFSELSNNKPYVVWNYWDELKPEEWRRLYNISHCPLFNSSVMLWKPGQNQRVWYHLLKTHPVAFYNYGMIDNWLFHRFGPWVYDDSQKNWFTPFEKSFVSKNGIINV